MFLMSEVEKRQVSRLRFTYVWELIDALLPYKEMLLEVDAYDGDDAAEIGNFNFFAHHSDEPDVCQIEVVVKPLESNIKSN